MSTEQVSSKHAYDAWRSFWNDFCLEWDSKRAATSAPFYGKVALNEAFGLDFLHIKQSPHQVTKICTPHKPDVEKYLLLAQVAGECTVAQGQNRGEMRIGDLTLIDTDRPVFFDYRNDSVQLSVPFSKELLCSAQDRYRVVTGRAIDGNTGFGLVLSSFLRTLYRCRITAEGCRSNEASAARIALVDLIRGATLTSKSGASASGRPSNVVASNVVLLQQWIEAHLAEPSLDPQMIADHYGISVRHLHRMFQSSGLSVSEWIRDRRLERCYRDLTDHQRRHIEITELAYRWGFSDSSQFSRAFRKAYNMSPRECRRISCEAFAVGSSGKVLPFGEAQRFVS